MNSFSFRSRFGSEVIIIRAQMKQISCFWNMEANLRASLSVRHLKCLNNQSWPKKEKDGEKISASFSEIEAVVRTTYSCHGEDQCFTTRKMKYRNKYKKGSGILTEESPRTPSLRLTLPGCRLPTLVQHFLCFYSQHFLSPGSSPDQQEDYCAHWCATSSLVSCY